MTATEKTILARLDEMYPNKNLLNITEVAAYTGLSIPYTRKWVGPVNGRYIDKVVLAHKLAGEDKE